jgi:hypothetical protein
VNIELSLVWAVVHAVRVTWPITFSYNEAVRYPRWAIFVVYILSFGLHIFVPQAQTIIMEKEGRIVVSKDGTSIWAEAVGTLSKPAVIFIHGFSCTGAAFDKQFCDPEILSNLYIVHFPYL